MNSTKILRMRAITLRKEGKSYNEISRKLDVAKSTLSYWLKGILLKPKYLKRLYTKQIHALSRGSQSIKMRRANEVNLILAKSRGDINQKFNKEAFRFFGIALYWAEGSKSKLLQITNSDPYLILFMVRWLGKIFNIKPSELKLSLNIYPQQDEKTIINFWSDLTKIPITNFGKTYIKPLSKNYKKNNSYYGTARIYVPKSTNFKYQLLGWLQAFLQDLDIDVKSVQERWTKLRSTARPVNLKND